MNALQKPAWRKPFSASNMKRLAKTLLVLALAGSASLDAEGWTDRLGLRFKDDCQEHANVIVAVFAWASSWLMARFGSQAGGACESRQFECAGGMSVTGLQVHFGRDDTRDRDFYDFKLRCGTSWQRYLGLRFESPDLEQEESVLCPNIKPATGIQVLRGRNNNGDKDWYGFKLRCDGQWKPVQGLAFDGYQETRTATCPKGKVVQGFRAHRGFQDWGDMDSYEFQLNCGVDGAARLPPRQPEPRSTTFGSRGYYGAAEKAQLLKELRGEL